MKVVRVPLRISFLGGGSDIPSHYKKHGGAVLSTTINKYIYLTAKPASPLFPHKYRLVYSKVEECNHPDEIEHPIIRTLVKQYNIKSLDLDVMSDVPAGTGLGSSSAFTVGLHALLSPKQLLNFELVTEACKTEIIDLKEPIGVQDQCAAAHGGLRLYAVSKVGRVENYVFSLTTFRGLEEQSILVYLGGQRRASTELQKPKPGRARITRMLSRLAVDAAGRFWRRDNDIGDLVGQGWELKRKLSPCPKADAIIDQAKAHGATGGKLLGAGGTGFVLLICPIKEQKRMLKGLKPLKLTYVPFKFEPEGCKVLYDDSKS